MKRIVSLLLIIVMMSVLFCLVGCKEEELPPEPVVEKPTCQHSGGDASCTQQPICTQCGKRYGNLAPHDFVKGVCSACGILQAHYLGIDNNYDKDDASYPAHPTAVDYTGNYVKDDEHRNRDMTTSVGALTAYLVTNKDEFDTKDLWINGLINLQRNTLNIGSIDIDLLVSLAPDYQDISGRGKISGDLMSVVIDCSIFINGGYIYIGRTFGSNKCAYKLSIQEIIDYIYDNTAVAPDNADTQSGGETQPSADNPKSMTDLITDMINILNQTDLYVVKHSLLPSLFPPSKYKYVMDNDFFQQQFNPLLESYEIDADNADVSTPSLLSGNVANEAEIVLVTDTLRPVGIQTTLRTTIHPEQGDSLLLTTVIAMQEFEYTNNGGVFAPPTQQEDYPYIPIEAFLALVAHDYQSLDDNSSMLQD